MAEPDPERLCSNEIDGASACQVDYRSHCTFSEDELEDLSDLDESSDEDTRDHRNRKCVRTMAPEEASPTFTELQDELAAEVALGRVGRDDEREEMSDDEKPTWRKSEEMSDDEKTAILQGTCGPNHYFGKSTAPTMRLPQDLAGTGDTESTEHPCSNVIDGACTFSEDDIEVPCDSIERLHNHPEDPCDVIHTPPDLPDLDSSEDEDTRDGH